MLLLLSFAICNYKDHLIFCVSVGVFNYFKKEGNEDKYPLSFIFMHYDLI